MGKIKVKGLKKLEKALKENVTLDDVKRVVRHNGAELQQKMQDYADFRGHMGYKDGKYQFIPPSGRLKGSIKYRTEDGGFTAVVEPTAEYAKYVEYGTRFMDAQPYERPAYIIQKVKFKKDMKKLVR